MQQRHRAKVNIRLLVGIALSVVVVGAGAFALRKWQRSQAIEKALRDGRLAFDRGEWGEAARLLGRYVGANMGRCAEPDVAEVCRNYAEALLRMQPFQPENARGAIAAYRILLRDGRFDPSICARLAFIYQATADPAELEYIAGMLKRHSPEDPRSVLWQAQAELGKQATEEARRILEMLISSIDGRDEHKSIYTQACMMAAATYGEAHAQEIARWLDHAVQNDPSSPEARIARARFLRKRSESADAKQREALRNSAREDLEQAERAAKIAPYIRLGLCEELRLFDLFDRARVQLDILRNAAPEELRESYLDLTDFQFDCAVQSIYLALRMDDFTSALAQTREALAGFPSPHYQKTLLPISIELTLQNNDVTLAGKQLDEFLRLTSADNTAEATKAYLKALIAKANDRPYEIINLLYPLRETTGFNAQLRDLLAYAFKRTGQQSRVAGLYKGAAPTDVKSLGPALSAIEVMLEAADFNGAMDSIRRLCFRFPDNLRLQLLNIESDLLNAGDSEAEIKAARDNAIARLSTLKSKFPADVGVRVTLAGVLATTGRLDEAEQELKNAVAECTSGPDALLEAGRFYVAHGRDENAEEMFKKARSAHPAEPASWLSSADFLLRKGRLDDARAVLEEGLSSVDTSRRMDVVRRLASVELLSPQTLDRGARRLLDLIEADDRDLESRSLLLESPTIREDTRLARRLIDEMKAVEGDSGLWWKLHTARLQVDELGRAADADVPRLRESSEALLDACITADPSWALPALILGELSDSSGAVDKAESTYRRSLETMPTPLVADRLLALLERERRYAEALSVMDRYAMAFTDRQYNTRRLSLAIASKDPDLIQRQSSLGAAAQSSDPQVLVLSALMEYAGHRNATEAEKVLKRAEAAGADPVILTDTRVSILKSEGRGDEVRRLLDELVEKHDSIRARLLRGNYFRSIGDASAAEEDFRKMPTLDDAERGYAYLAQFFVEQGRFDDAITLADEALTSHPDSKDLVRGLVTSLLSRRKPGDLDRAAGIIDQLPPERIDTDLLWVRAMIADTVGGAGSVERVQALLKQAAANPTAPPGTYRGLASLAMRYGDDDSATKLLNAAARQHGDAHPVIQLLKANAAVFRGQWMVALRHVRRALRHDPADPESYELVLGISQTLGDATFIGEFMMELDRGMAAAPRLDRLRLIHARLLQYTGRTKEAISTLDEYLELRGPGPDNLTILLTLADLAKSENDLPLVEKYVKLAEAESPESTAVLKAKADLLGIQSKFDDINAMAQKVLEKGKEVDARGQDFVLYAAGILANTQQKPQRELAIALYSRLIDSFPELIPARLALSLAYYQNGEVAKSEESYRRTIEVYPNRDEALNNLAWILFREKGDAQGAVAYAERAIAQRPNAPEYRDTLAEILLAVPKLAEARDQFAKTVELTPRDSAKRAHAHLQLARVCVKLRQVNDAVRSLEEARRIDTKCRIETGQNVLSGPEREEVEKTLAELRSKPE